MKKKILLVAAVVMCLAIATAGTLAYFTSEDTAHNVITSGDVNIELVEQTKKEDGTLVEFPEEGIKGVMPGTSASKIVQVKNTGDNDAWVRLKMEVTITGEDGSDLSDEGIKYVHIYGTSGEWKLNWDDRNFYYEKVLAPGETTEPVMEEVRFSAEMGNAYQNCTANVVISAQAVQTANNGDTVMEAAGWPDGE